MPQKSSMHVAVLIETDDSWGRNIVEAIARYALEADWTLLLCPRDEERRLRLPAGWHGDGILVSLRDQSTVEHVKAKGVPAVDVSAVLPDQTWLGRVSTDDSIRVRMAFEHLSNLGFKEFACYAPSIGRYSDRRALIFRDVVEEAGYSCAIFPDPDRQSDSDWLTDCAGIRQWLSTLPCPVAMFAADPYPARQLAEICHHSGLKIPDDLALMSGDDDRLLCNVAWPPISSVELASHRIGKEACEMLEWMYKNSSVPEQPKLIPPLRVCARHSTEILAVEDEDLAEILRFISERATEGIQVTSILESFPISRRALEMRFREVLGRSPAEEIRRVRLRSARNLVIETELSISAIAHRCGFSDGASLSHAFRRYFQSSPGELRRARQNGQTNR